MTFTFDQAHAYFVTRLSEHSLPHRDAITTRCPFHGDRTASLSISLGKGGLWNCHACNIGGGLYDFETRMFPDRTPEQAWEYIYRLTGATPTHDSQQRKLGPLVATYAYMDEDGKVLFEKRRHEPKTFTQRAPKGTGWVASLQGVRKVLYNLRAVMAAKVVFICEGEKDCDALSAALGGEVTLGGQAWTTAATCNFDGAGKWKDEYAAYFAGRRVLILPDNDDPGRAHAASVAISVAKFARSVKIIELPGLPEKGDVSDYLQCGTITQLLDEVKKTPLYSAATATVEKPFLVPPAAILPHGCSDVRWIIPGVIHRGAKGLFVAQPKAGKSMVALDLALALSAGRPWLGMDPVEPLTVAVVSREDGPQMTMHRIREFARGRGLNFADISRLQVNTFEQSATFAIDNDEDVARLCVALKAAGTELVIFDVLNKLHSADENDNTKMTAIMARFDHIRAETGADVAVIHHDAKNSTPGAKRPRGASSIDSWWDWKVSIQVDVQDDSRKEVFFASKAGQPHPPITVRFESSTLYGSRIVPVVQ